MKTAKYYLIIFIFISNLMLTSFAQPLNRINPTSFEMSSLNDKFFIATGLYKGEFQVYNEFVEVNINNGLIKITNHPEYKGTPFITSISIGLGTNLDNGRWDIYSNSISFPIDKPMAANESYQLPPALKFLIPRNPNIELNKSWLVVTINTTKIINGQQGVKGYCYAHSNKDIFQKSYIQWNK